MARYQYKLETREINGETVNVKVYSPSRRKAHGRIRFRKENINPRYALIAANGFYVCPICGNDRPKYQRVIKNNIVTYQTVCSACEVEMEERMGEQ